MPIDVQHLLRMYRRGAMTAQEVVHRVIDLAAEPDPRELVAQLPDDFLGAVRRRVAQAPTTDEGWAATVAIAGGTFVRGFDWDAERRRAGSRYRAGVEALRDCFGRASSDD